MLESETYKSARPVILGTDVYSWTYNETVVP